MIIHSYLTSGFYPWAEMFLKSYNYHNGEDIKIILTTKNLKNHEIERLYSLYGNLKILNHDLDIRKLAVKAKLNRQNLLALKKQVEEDHVTEKNKVWKLLIAADDRVKSTYRVMKNNKNEDYMLHTDIDLYFRNNIKSLKNFIKKHDISIRLRLHSKLNRKTMIGIQGYKVNEKSLSFMKKWIEYIDNVPPHLRPLGYGQTSCYYAYMDFKDKVKWGNVPIKYLAPQMRDTDIIWSANTKKGKTENLKFCYLDFEEIKNGNKTDNPI